MLARESKSPKVVGANMHSDGEAHLNRLKAPLKLSVIHFQRAFQTYRRSFWQAPVVLRRFVENRVVGRL
jgi:hypothetical protein